MIYAFAKLSGNHLAAFEWNDDSTDWSTGLDLDFINLMTYDLHGSWETETGHNSPLYAGSWETGDQRYLNMDWAARYWVEKGAPADKINVGMGLYGRSFTLASESNFDLGDPAPRAGQAGQFTREAGFIAYYEVCDLKNRGGQIEYSNEQKVPYIHLGTQWVGYDNPESLREKVRYVKQNHFGGVMVWALPLDDFSGHHCGQGPFPLMHAINDECEHTTGSL
nr:hypothetical protein BaRGS_024933 [Batillaria attramentaria]